MILTKVMSAGGPFVSTLVDGIPKLAREGGILVDVENDAGLATQLIGLLKDAQRTRRRSGARYEQDGVAGLSDLPRSGKPLVHSQEVRARLIAKACARPPETPEGAQQERWTYEQLGATVGMLASHAHAILSRAEVKPHRTDYWIMATSPGPSSRRAHGSPPDYELRKSRGSWMSLLPAPSASMN